MKTNIPIHRHTKVRYKKSKYTILNCYPHIYMPGEPLVTDLQRVREEDCLCPERRIGAFSKYCSVHEPLNPSLIKKYPVPEGYDVVPLSYGGFTFKKKLGFWRNLWQNKIRRKLNE